MASWLLIPIAITVASLLWALFWPINEGRGYLSGIGRIFTLIAALGISLVAWIVTAIVYATVI